MISTKIIRIVLAVTIVANVAIGFAPSRTAVSPISTRTTTSSTPLITTTTTTTAATSQKQQCLQRQPYQQHRSRRCQRSSLCVSQQQQQNEYTETSPSRTTNNSSMDSNTSNNSAELNGSTTAAASGGAGLAQVVLKDENHYVELAIRRTICWVAAAIMFGVSLGFIAGSETSEEFFAGYLLEQSLSIDNLLVFLLLFEYFKIPLENQNRVLNWGIIGAIGMRAVMIGAGAVAIQQFRAVLLVFAAILIFSSGKVILGSEDDDEEDLSENQIVKFSNNLISSTDQFDGDRFFTTVNGIKTATPMLLCMVAVEISDVIFAVDSIPAVFGVTEVRDCFFLRMIF